MPHPASALPPRLSTRELVLCGLLGALLVALKEPLSMLPVEPVTLLLILYTLVFPRLAPWIIAEFIALECLIYGFGLWLWMYLYIWWMLYFAVRLFRRQDHPLFWAIFSGAFGLCFGLLCAPVYLVLSGPGGAIAWWLSGIPTDVAHCACNFVVMLLLYRPLRSAFARVSAQL